MKSTKFPTLEETLYLHELLISRFGGASGVSDLGLVESALARPRSGYYKTLSAQAAAMMHSFVKNHGFRDGNKRMGLALTATFLMMNGYELRSSANQSERFILEIINSRSLTFDEIVKWIESHLYKL